MILSCFVRDFFSNQYTSGGHGFGERGCAPIIMQFEVMIGYMPTETVLHSVYFSAHISIQFDRLDGNEEKCFNLQFDCNFWEA